MFVFDIFNSFIRQPLQRNACLCDDLIYWKKMPFATELQDLRIFASQHLPSARPADDPRGPLHCSEFGPPIHEFRHRAEVFLLTSGYFDEAAYEQHQIGLAMPDTVFVHLEDALFRWESKQSSPYGLQKEKKKPRGGL